MTAPVEVSVPATPDVPSRGMAQRLRLGSLASLTVRLVVTVLIVCVVFAVGLSNFVNSESNLNLVNTWLIYSIAGVGFYFIFGLAGRFAFSQTFMMSVGGYTCALLLADHGFWIALLAAIGATSVAALILGLVAGRTTDFSFSIVTLGITQIGSVVFQHWTAFAGQDGTVVNIPLPTVFGYNFTTQKSFIWLLMAGLAVCLVAAALIDSSPVRRRAIATRDDPMVATSLGIGVNKLRLQLFVLGSALGALAGALYVSFQGFMSYNTFNLDLGVGMFLMLMLGGSGSMWGAPIGAFVYVFVPVLLQGFAQYQVIIYGVALIVLMVVFPQGIVGFTSALWQRVRNMLGWRGTSRLSGGTASVLVDEQDERVTS